MNKIKKKFVINVSVAVLLVLAFLYLGMKYLVKEIETSSAQIVSGKQAVYVQNAKNAQLSESKKQDEEMSLEMNKVSESVVDKGKAVVFIEDVENVAREDRVKLKIKASDSKGKEAAGAAITSSYFNFTVGGAFDDVMLFLGTMENFKYYFDIENIKMSFGDFDEFDKNMIVLTFDVKLYQKDGQK
ncbi:MAG: hypothetical protein WCQ96_01620 [Patescibacteria group bacterium]